MNEDVRDFIATTERLAEKRGVSPKTYFFAMLEALEQAKAVYTDEQQINEYAAELMKLKFPLEKGGAA